MTWKDMLVKLVDMITEDKIVGMVCLSVLGYFAITKYPTEIGVPVIAAIIAGICGFITGGKVNK